MEAIIDNQSRKCSKCKRNLPFVHFSKSRRKRSGFESQCKVCTKERVLSNELDRIQKLKLSRLTNVDVVCAKAYESDRTYYIFRSTHEQVVLTITISDHVSSSVPLFEYEKAYLKANYPYFKFYSP